MELQAMVQSRILMLPLKEVHSGRGTGRDCSVIECVWWLGPIPSLQNPWCILYIPGWELGLDTFEEQIVGPCSGLPHRDTYGAGHLPRICTKLAQKCIQVNL